MKAALSMLLLLLPTYTFAAAGNDPLPEEIHYITGKLEAKNGTHEKYLYVINEILQKNDDGYTFNFKNNGYKCALSKFDIIFNNTSKGINSLFTEDNEEVLKEAMDDYKLRLMLDLDKLGPSQLNLKNLKQEFQGTCLKFFGNLRKKFFQVYKNDEIVGVNTDEENNNLNWGNRFDENYDSNSSSNSDASSSSSSQDNKDLSEVPNDEEDDEEGKGVVENAHNVENNTGSYSFSSHSSQKIIYDGNNVFEENESSVSNNEKEEEAYGPMNKNKALEILLKNTTFVIEGFCTEEEPKEKPFIVFFNSTLSRNHIQTACNVNGKNNLRGSAFGANPPLPFQPLNPEEMSKMMTDMLKFFENPHDANNMLLPFFGKMNFLEALENLGLPQELDFDNIFKDYMKGHGFPEIKGNNKNGNNNNNNNNNNSGNNNDPQDNMNDPVDSNEKN
ncbi:parasitophorous vacuolar protein 1, putative [Plasmodium ovale]|uniref:Parasitophorous vacuolar protein 1, putative n=2 Tax=Plasmodium ovale TaxID=36330 RepID=A0A1D3TI58_PLAOA|nr:parasitophorous vacuolar protein 1, putative [Plasmodium ovale]